MSDVTMVTMSDASSNATEEVVHKKARKDVTRFYLDSEGELYGSCKGVNRTHHIPASHMKRLAQEGYIHLFQTGHSHHAIYGGLAFIDRSPPSPKAVKAVKALKIPKVTMTAEQKAANRAARKQETATKKALLKRLNSLSVSELKVVTDAVVTG